MARKRHPRAGRELEFELWNRMYGRRVAAEALAHTRTWNPEAEPMNESLVVYEVVRILEDLQVPYAIVGGYSAIFWGRPRTTQDADLVIQIPPHRIESLVRALSPNFVVSLKAAQDAARLHGEFNAIHRTEVFKVDLWVAGTAFDREVLRRGRREQLTPELTAFVQTPEDTILSKLRWCTLSNMSERQFSDVLGVYEIQEPTLDQGYLDDWAVRLQLTDLLARVRREAARGD
jgi:hypothetical protein